MLDDNSGAAGADAIPAPGVLTVDLGAIRANYTRLREIAGSPVGAVVKANAYGLGAERISKALFDEGCRNFFVAHLGEALSLRPNLPEDATLYVLNGLLPGGEGVCAEAGIVPVLNSLEQIDAWAETAKQLGGNLLAVLQFDTGMSRLGIAPEERALAVERLRNAPIDIVFVMSHLASADEPTAPQNASQAAEMARAAAAFGTDKICFANSGGIFLGANFRGALARTGIALYGGATQNGVDSPLRHAVALTLAVIQTRTVAAGARIGYGGTHVATRPMRLATLAAGYADGLPRSLSDRGAVFCDGIRLPIVGRVSMDSMVVDISALPEGRLVLGSHVEMLGPHQSMDDLARDAGTISYEILTGLGSRFARLYR
jgi:alanine racemase